MTQTEALKLALEASKDECKQYAIEQVQEILEQAISEAAKQEQGEPVAWVDLLKEAQQIVESKFLWKRFIDGTPLANDIPCWMADFAQQYTTPQQRKPLTRDDLWKLWCNAKAESEYFFWSDFARAIEQAHGIKE